MPRRVQGPPPGAEAWFTPTALGNDKAPDGGRVRVNLRYPTEADKRRIDKTAAVVTFHIGEDGKLKTNEDGSYSFSVKDSDTEKAKKVLLEMFVVDVEGYEMAGGAPITNGGELFEHGETEIVDEVADELRNGLYLLAQEKKTYKDSPGSSHPEQDRSLGTAENADDSSSPTPGGTTDQQIMTS